MTTTSGAFDVIRARATALGLPYPLFYQGESFVVPDDFGTFGYVELIVERSAIVAFGGGAGANVHRHPATLSAYVFVAAGSGLKVATDAAELFAAGFRSYRDANISCFTATVRPGGDASQMKPPGMSSAVDGYYWAEVEVELFFDLIG